MKKLLTLIVTLCIFFIGLKPVKAVNTIVTQVQTGRLEYYNSNNVFAYDTISCSGNRCTFQNIDYTQLSAFWFYFSSNQSVLTSHLVFTGSITFETQMDYNLDSFVNYLPESISAIGLTAGDGITRTASCSLNNLSISNDNRLLGQTSSPVNSVYGKTYNFTVDCLTDSMLSNGQNQNILQFYINTPRFPQNDYLVTSIELNTYTIGYNGEYTDDIQSLVTAIQNINFNGATINVDQSPVTGAIENQTQQINDTINSNLTTEHCTSCDNLYNMPTENRNTNGVLFSSSNQKLSLNGTFSGSGIFPFFNTSVSISAGTYTFIMSQALNRIIYPMWNQDDCYIPAGSTSVTCTISTSRNVGWRYNFAQNEVINYTDLQFYVGTSGQFCVYGSDSCTSSNKLDDINSSIQQTTDYLTEDPSTKVNNLTDGIETHLLNIGEQQDQFHLLDFIRFPLYILQAINNSTDWCMNGITLPLPYSIRSIHIPCMSYYMHTYAGVLVDFYQITITAFTYYYIFRAIWKKLTSVANFNIHAEEL